MHQSSFRMKPCVNKELRTQQRLIVIYDDWLAQTSSDIIKKPPHCLLTCFAQNVFFGEIYSVVYYNLFFVKNMLI